MHFLPQQSILHDLFTIEFNEKTLGVQKLLATTVGLMCILAGGRNQTWDPLIDSLEHY